MSCEKDNASGLQSSEIAATHVTKGVSEEDKGERNKRREASPSNPHKMKEKGSHRGAEGKKGEGKSKGSGRGESDAQHKSKKGIPEAETFRGEETINYIEPSNSPLARREL